MQVLFREPWLHNRRSSYILDLQSAHAQMHRDAKRGQIIGHRQRYSAVPCSNAKVHIRARMMYEQSECGGKKARRGSDIDLRIYTFKAGKRTIDSLLPVPNSHDLDCRLGTQVMVKFKHLQYGIISQ